MKIIIYLITILLFVSCTKDDIETDGYKLTLNVNYNGDALVKRVNVAVFNFEDGIDTKPPKATYMPTASDSYTFPETISLEGLKTGEYIAIIYGDVDPEDGKMKNEPGDPFVITEKIVIDDKDLSMDLELKDNSTTCTENEKRCEGNNVEVCQADGSWLLETTCIESETCNSTSFTCEATETVGMINFTVSYEGNRSLKRVLVALYKEGTSTNGMPDEIFTMPEAPADTLVFPYIFSITPSLNEKYNVKLLADELTTGQPNYETASFSDFKEVTVVEAGVDISFTLIDPVSCTENEKRCEGNNVEVCKADGSWLLETTCIESETCNATSFTCEATQENKINFTLNYTGSENLKRVMVAFYKGEATGMPDKTVTIPEVPNEVLVFPYTFSITPEENRIYNIKLKADTKTEGMPEHIFGGVESEAKEVDVTDADADAVFTLVDPS